MFQSKHISYASLQIHSDVVLVASVKPNDTIQVSPWVNGIGQNITTFTVEQAREWGQLLINLADQVASRISE